MLQYIIDIPYERKERCAEIGLQINRMKNVYTLILCHNKKAKKVLFYLECDERCINELCVCKKCLDSEVFIAKEFWEKVVVSDWIIYTFVEGSECYNRIMIHRIFNF